MKERHGPENLIRQKMLWKQPQGLERDQRPCNSKKNKRMGGVARREEKKNWLWDKGAKTRQAISTRTKGKMCSKWCHGNGVSLLSSERNQKKSWCEGSGSYRTAARDRGTSYPAQLSFVCWSHCFYPDWMKSQAAFCLALLTALDKCWRGGKQLRGACQQETPENSNNNSTVHTVNQVLTACNFQNTVQHLLNDYLSCTEKHASLALTYQATRYLYLALLWWEYLLRWWRRSAAPIRGRDCFLERIYPSRAVWSL